MWIRIDPEQSKPHERTGFRHPNIVEWTKANRGKILSALLTMCRAWFADGSPKYNTPVMGSFDHWTRTVGNILAHSGISGFLANAGELWETADSEGTEWEAFLSHWLDVFGNEPITTKTLVNACENSTMLGHSIANVLPSCISDAISGKGDCCAKIGRRFTERKGRHYGPEGYHIVKGKATNQGKTWIVAKKSDGSDGNYISTDFFDGDTSKDINNESGGSMKQPSLPSQPSLSTTSTPNVEVNTTDLEAENIDTGYCPRCQSTFTYRRIGNSRQMVTKCKCEK